MLESILKSIKERRKKKAELEYKKILKEIESTEQSPEYKEEERKRALEKRREDFLSGLDYFSGNLTEYENLKGKRYDLIDLKNNGCKTRIYDPDQFFLAVAQLYYKRDKEGNRIKDKHGKYIKTNYYEIQTKLIDNLMEQKCVGLINAEYNGKGFCGNQFAFWSGYPVKEK
ncbi:MAG: hypothetical protein ACP5NV_06835 [Candidatus Woesearchaeota archaeon]